MNQYWIWFSNLEDVSPASKQRLLMKFRDARAVYEAHDSDYQTVGLSDRERRILAKKNLCDVDRILKICAQQKIQIITIDDPVYPALLREIANPPYVLYVRGNFPEIDSRFTFGVVGTRKADQSGIEIAYRLAGELSRSGAYVISGMAEGIDGAANTGALDAGGETLAVLGCGVDVCYPTFHERLMAQIIERGAVVSEFPPGTPPYPENFPIRNRIISGLSRGILVVEAPEKSGAQITARFAQQQNRDLFVTPGSIDSYLYRGSNQLIKDGAKMVLNVGDILEEYKTRYPDLKVIGETQTANIDWGDLSDDEKQVLKTIGYEELSADEIIQKSELSAQAVLPALTVLELKGIIDQNAGRRFRLAQGF